MQKITTRLRKILAFRLAGIGEHIGMHQLIYNPWMMLEFNEHGNREAPKVYDAIMECFPNIKSVLDVGSGSGSFAAEGLKRGMVVLAAEHSWVGRKLAGKKGVACLPFDLKRNPPAQISGNFDLIYSFEVAEHLPPPMGDELVRFLSSFQKPVLFTAAHKGQGGIGHINEQPPQYWIDRFQQNGMALDAIRTELIRRSFHRNDAAFWFYENAIVLVPNL